MTTNLTITTKQNLDKSNTVPMVKGRGATTCLICNKDGDFVMNNVSTVLGIKRLFDTTDVISQLIKMFSSLLNFLISHLLVQRSTHVLSNLHQVHRSTSSIVRLSHS